ncbi:MAG: hypothetical protein FD174_1676 [Geobacteraceae bacterium]|nr:MAG: hypothetical protein FD174_1676 [Geobacteraceae bacterium]
MKGKISELTKLKGVGKVLAGRLTEVGIDTFEKVVAAGEEGLKRIRGLNPRMIPSILAQANDLAGEAAKSRETKIEELKKRAAALKEQVQGIAIGVRDRFKEEVAGKNGRKVEKEILKAVTSLEKVEAKLAKRVKRAGKGLAKAEKRLAVLGDAGLKVVGKGLKKARKSLKRIYA